MTRTSEPCVLIVGQPDFLSSAAESHLAAMGVTIIGPHRPERALGLMRSPVAFDGAIVELGLEEEAFVAIVEALEEMAIAYLFAVPRRPDGEVYGGFVLGEREEDVAAILDALQQMPG